MDTSINHTHFKGLQRVEINLESVGFEPLTQTRPNISYQNHDFQVYFLPRGREGPWISSVSRGTLGPIVLEK